MAPKVSRIWKSGSYFLPIFTSPSYLRVFMLLSNWHWTEWNTRMKIGQNISLKPPLRKFILLLSVVTTFMLMLCFFWQSKVLHRFLFKGIREENFSGRLKFLLACDAQSTARTDKKESTRSRDTLLSEDGGVQLASAPLFLKWCMLSFQVPCKQISNFKNNIDKQEINFKNDLQIIRKALKSIAKKAEKEATF